MKEETFIVSNFYIVEANFSFIQFPKSREGPGKALSF